MSIVYVIYVDTNVLLHMLGVFGDFLAIALRYICFGRAAACAYTLVLVEFESWSFPVVPIGLLLHPISCKRFVLL